jgi:hypothetical protein
MIQEITAASNIVMPPPRTARKRLFFTAFKTPGYCHAEK